MAPGMGMQIYVIGSGGGGERSSAVQLKDKLIGLQTLRRGGQK